MNSERTYRALVLIFYNVTRHFENCKSNFTIQEISHIRESCHKFKSVFSLVRFLCNLFFMLHIANNSSKDMESIVGVSRK